MKPVKQFMIYSFTIVLTFFVSTHLVQAEVPSSSIEYQVKVQRATQAAVWAMRAGSLGGHKNVGTLTRRSSCCTS